MTKKAGEIWRELSDKTVGCMKINDRFKSAMILKKG